MTADLYASRVAGLCELCGRRFGARPPMPRFCATCKATRPESAMAQPEAARSLLLALVVPGPARQYRPGWPTHRAKARRARRARWAPCGDRVGGPDPGGSRVPARPRA